jgi:multidrug efflux pump subunit AcrB
MIGDLTGSPEPIEIKLFSQNPDELATWAPRVADAIKKLGPVKDVKDGIENTISGPAVIYHVDPIVAARSGFSPQEVEIDVSATMQGEPAPTPVVLNDRPYTLRVLFPPSNRASVQAIQDTLLVSSTGRTATLGTLSHIEEQPGQTEIRRENLQRDVAVTGRFEDISLGKGIELVQRAVAKLGVPGDIRIQYGGTYEEQQKSFHDLLVVLMIAIVLVFIVLLFEFGSFSAPISILLSALLSTAGVFIALLVTGTTFNISSFMGVIMVVGIVAKNGILLLDADQKFRAEGASARAAMIKAGERRLRPIVMTAMATIAGMIPLALGIGAGSQMLQPLAIAVIGGILASMILSLIVTPAAYYRMSGEK